MYVYIKYVKKLTIYRTRIWHWRAAVLDPFGYIQIMNCDKVKDDDGKGKRGWKDIASLLCKKMLVEIRLDNENDLKGYEFIYDEQFVKDFQIMTGDIWDSVVGIDLDELSNDIADKITKMEKSECKKDK